MKFGFQFLVVMCYRLVTAKYQVQKKEREQVLGLKVQFRVKVLVFQELWNSGPFTAVLYEYKHTMKGFAQNH